MSTRRKRLSCLEDSQDSFVKKHGVLKLARFVWPWGLALPLPPQCFPSHQSCWHQLVGSADSCSHSPGHSYQYVASPETAPPIPRRPLRRWKPVDPALCGPRRRAPLPARTQAGVLARESYSTRWSIRNRSPAAAARARERASAPCLAARKCFFFCWHPSAEGPNAFCATARKTPDSGVTIGNFFG